MKTNKDSLREAVMSILGSSINFEGLADDWYIKHTEDTDKILSLLTSHIEEAERKAREIFVPVKGAEGYYEVSNTGKVRSILGGRRKGVELRQCKRTKAGYLSVSLVKGRQVQSASVHRLVASAFLSNPDNKRTVNHKDNNPANNDVSNLEWATYSEQEVHAYKLGKVNANHPSRLEQLKQTKGVE